MTLGERIRVLRNAHNMSQEELAAAIGIGRVAVSNLERNKAIPLTTTLEKLASVLDVSIDYLMGRDEETKKASANDGEDKMQSARIDTDLIEIPVVSREMTACCGPGIGALDVTSDSEDTVGIPRNDLRAFDDLRPPFAIYANGDCLSSDGIDSDDRVVINPAEMPQNGAIALVSMFGMLALKRYYHLSNGDVILRSDEGERRLTSAEQEDACFSVIGAMVACVKKRPVAKPL